jgi:dihydroorotase
MALYAQAFDAAGALHRLEAFASHFGADFYGLPRNTTTLSLEKHDWQVPDSYPLGDSVVVPMFAGETLHWRVKGQT